MRVLVINSGSSSLKFDLVEVSGGGSQQDTQLQRLAHGAIDSIGGDATFELNSPTSPQAEKKSVKAAGYKEAVALALSALSLKGTLPSVATEKIDAVGHRVVHGGDRYVAPTLIDDAVIKGIRDLCELAPLHNPAALDGIKATRKALGRSVPMVAVFDTAFHATLPDYAYTYALPYELAEKHKIRRYGFHGTAHEYMLEQYLVLAGVPREEATIVTLQLGNGCSAAAISGGKSVDTSMGFTPLEGLVMGTRSGDLDPSVVDFLAEKERVSAKLVEEWLNTRSGLLGVSGSASDMRSLLASSAKGDKHARLAIELFCYRVRKYIGAYMAALGGADALVFGGGIGENSPIIRKQILSGMEWLGLKVDKTLNEAAVGMTSKINSADSPVSMFVIPVDEALLIARQTAEVIGG